MATVHIPGDGHVTPVRGVSTNGTIFHWLAFSDAKKIKVIEDALHILKRNVKGLRPCNNCFSRLPNGRTFDDILDDPSIFISFDPSNDGRSFGARSGNDITICHFSIRMGRWTVAATLVHEFAHVNGAPGTNHRAEGTLLCCGFSGLHDPTIIGAVERPSNTRIA